jgi:hypothetical protein
MAPVTATGEGCRGGMDAGRLTLSWTARGDVRATRARCRASLAQTLAMLDARGGSAQGSQGGRLPRLPAIEAPTAWVSRMGKSHG